MEDIDLRKADSSNLDSAYGGKRYDDAHAAEAIKDKYKNINISDMINPTMGKNLKKEYHADPFKEYVKNKEAQKNLSVSMFKIFGFVILVAALLVFLFWYL